MRILHRSSHAGLLGVLAVCGLALCATTPLGAQRPTTMRGDLSVSGDWLQANALPLDRDALHSLSIMGSYRLPSWSVDAGWLRIARNLSSIQGGSVLVGRPFTWQSLLVTPAVGILGGKAEASADTTGFDWVASDGTVGHTPRYSHSTSGTFGGGVALTITYPVYRGLGIRVGAQQWVFSGDPLEGDRARTLVGAGLSVRVR